MVKTFIKQWILVFGFVVIAAFTIPPIFNGYWDGTWLILHLLITTLTACLFVFLLGRLSIEIPLLRHFVNMCAVLAVVLAYGWVFAWYTPTGVWIIFLMVIPVYVAIALLDAVKIRQDIKSINAQIQHRKLKRQMEKENISQ